MSDKHVALAVMFDVPAGEDYRYLGAKRKNVLLNSQTQYFWFWSHVMMSVSSEQLDWSNDCSAC